MNCQHCNQPIELHYAVEENGMLRINESGRPILRRCNAELRFIIRAHFAPILLSVEEPAPKETSLYQLLHESNDLLRTDSAVVISQSFTTFLAHLKRFVAKVIIDHGRMFSFSHAILNVKDIRDGEFKKKPLPEIDRIGEFDLVVIDLCHDKTAHSADSGFIDDILNKRDALRKPTWFVAQDKSLGRTFSFDDGASTRDRIITLPLIDLRPKESKLGGVEVSGKKLSDQFLELSKSRKV